MGIVAVLTDRLQWVSINKYLTTVDQFWFNDWQTEDVSNWPTANHYGILLQRLSLLQQLCKVDNEVFYMADVNIVLLQN